MTLTTTTIQQASAAASIRTRRVWTAGLTAAVAGATIAAGYGAILDAEGVPMWAGNIGAATAQPVTPGNFAVGVILCTVGATALAVVLARRSLRPTRAFVSITIGLAVLSLLSPAAAAHTATATRVTFALGHVIAASVVIPIIARRLRTITAARP